MKLYEFKIGDIAVITKNEDNIKDRYFPEGLITEVIATGYKQDRYDKTIKVFNINIIWTFFSNLKLSYRPATERETFLYHILGHSYCMNDIDQEEK